MKHISEEELIAYHVGELSAWQRMLLRRRLERDAALASESEEIAATLRAFACDAAVAPPAGAAERAWERVRPSLTVLEAAPRSGKGRFWAGASAGALATAAVVAAVAMHSTRLAPVVPAPAINNAAMSTKSWGDGLLKELHMRRPAAQINQRPGPLTTAPVDVVADNPALATHLDTAERVLTEVNHTQGALPEDTRAQVHQLLLENAMYHETAERHGDMATAAVIDDLGRVLISLDAEPLPSAHGKDAEPDAFRMQVNVGGVLLDLRILHRNPSAKNAQ